MAGWEQAAACAGSGPGRWYPTVGAGGNHGRPAKLVCAGCPVRTECLVTALRNREPAGIWGGAGEDIRRDLGRALLLADHDPLARPAGCRCRWCATLADHFAVLEAGVKVRRRDRNGPGATHGRRVTYARGCRCAPCAFAAELDTQETKYRMPA